MQVNFYIRTGMFLLFLVFSGLLLPAQTIGKITGTAQDEDGKGFPDVSLRLGRESATMSNSEGSFILRIPAGKEDTLKLAFIGYQTLLIPFSMLRERMVIPMKPAVNQLQEVRISALNGAQIVRNAIHHIPDNYPLFPFEAIGFYREVGKLDSNYLSFAEAGLLVFKQGYGQHKLKDQEEEAYLINFDQKVEVNEALYQGTMVIIKSSFAIASVDFRLSEKGRAYARPDIPLLQRPILSLLGYHFEKKEERLSLRYYKINKKWYPYYYHIATSHKVKARKQKINAELSISAELFIAKLNDSGRLAPTGLKVMPADQLSKLFLNMTYHIQESDDTVQKNYSCCKIGLVFPAVVFRSTQCF